MSAASSHLADEFTEVVTNVQRALQPVAPPPAFREHLRDRLRRAAEHQQTHRALGIESARRGGTAWNWIVSAALLGALIGFIAIQLGTPRRRITI